MRRTTERRYLSRSKVHHRPGLGRHDFPPAGHSGSMTTKPYDKLTGRFTVATGPSQLPVSAFRASVTVIMRVIGSIGEATNPDLS